MSAPPQSGQGPKSAKGAKCPICRKPVQPEFRPFCSVRCKQIDLNRWLTESYRVPDRPVEESDEEERPEPREEEE